MASQPRPVAPLPRVAMRIPEAARSLGVSVRYVERLIATGDLPSCKPSGNTRLIPVAELRRWVERNVQTEAGA